MKEDVMKHINKFQKPSFFVCLMAFTLLFVPAQAQEDVTPPELVEFSFSPASIDVSAGSQNVTFTLRITDDVSGFFDSGITLMSQSGQQSNGTSFSGAFNRISGDAQDGVYEVVMTFPQFSEAGTWHIRDVNVRDEARNRRGLSETDLISMGFPTELIVGLLELQVQMDIIPGSDPNSINPKSRGIIPVAILTTPSFEATTVDPMSVAFGPDGATESHGKGHIEDADNDGDMDMVLHFKTQDTGIQCGDTEASLTGQTFEGQAIAGSDAIQTDGCGSAKAMAGVEAGIPEDYGLLQNYPNPFNPETEIRFQLPEAGQVMVKIFNINGEEIRTLLNGQYEAGYHRVRWDGKDKNGNAVASGVYLYELRAGSFSQVRKMSLLR
jgi:hypothetical protein